MAVKSYIDAIREAMDLALEKDDDVIIFGEDVEKNGGGADVKIMDRFFRHRELPDSESFSKPGFQLKTA